MTTANDRSRSNKRAALRLSLVVLAMFGFGFALVPLYDVLCQITGLNGKTGRVEAASLDGRVDTSRSVTVEFIGLHVELKRLPKPFDACVVVFGPNQQRKLAVGLTKKPFGDVRADVARGPSHEDCHRGSSLWAWARSQERQELVGGIEVHPVACVLDREHRNSRIPARDSLDPLAVGG